jgi:arylsulfatase A-like enzyme
LPFNAPHGPIEAPDKYTSRFPGIDDSGRRTFAGMLSAMDDAVGAVLAKVRESGQEENTLIVFISDNGAPNNPHTSNSNRPLRGYKAQLLEGGIRVPFMVQWKGRLPAGKTDDRPVIQLDVLPTVLAAAGITAPADARLDGVNLLPYLNGERTDAPHEALFWRYSGQRAVRAGDWKLLHTKKKTQLFNLAADLGEKTDLAAKHPDKVAELEAAFQQWNTHNKPAREAKRNGEPAQEPDEDQP